MVGRTCRVCTSRGTLQSKASQVRAVDQRGSTSLVLWRFAVLQACRPHGRQALFNAMPSGAMVLCFRSALRMLDSMCAWAR